MRAATASRDAGLRRAVSLLLLCAALVPALTAACSSSSPGTSSSPSSIEEAFESSHPGGALPPGLKPADDADLRPEELGRASGLARVLVPGWLPAGYALAAPYVAVGDGGALPNPQVWKGGYRISFTDSAWPRDPSGRLGAPARRRRMGAARRAAGVASPSGAAKRTGS